MPTLHEMSAILNNVGMGSTMLERIDEQIDMMGE